MSISLKSLYDQVQSIKTAVVKHSSPNISAGKKISTGFKCTEPGFIVTGDTYNLQATLWLAVNNVQLFDWSNTAHNMYWTNSNVCIPVTVNDVITFSIANYTHNTVRAGVWFYPAILTKYYFVRHNIIYRATHLLEKIFYVLNKGGVSL